MSTPPGSISQATWDALQSTLGSYERLTRMSEKERKDCHKFNQLNNQSMLGGVNFLKADFLKDATEEEALALLAYVRKNMLQIMPGAVPRGKEQKIAAQLKAAHAAGHIQFGEQNEGYVAQFSDVVGSPLSNSHLYPDLAKMLFRLATAFKASTHMRSRFGSADVSTFSTLLRDIAAGLHSTPSVKPMHGDKFCESHFPGLHEAKRELAGIDGIYFGVRMCLTLETPNVTEVCDCKSGWLYGVEAPCAGGAVAMPLDIRGYLLGVITRLLHAGGTTSLDGTELPRRQQLLMDFAVFDLHAWNDTMNYFRLQDIKEALVLGDLKLDDEATREMFVTLAAAVERAAPRPDSPVFAEMHD